MDNKVRNNSPDETQYHESVEGMPGTMIPRAGRAGESLGFDHNQPNKVVVDPGEDGGGFELDLEKLASTRKQFNSAAVRKEVAADPTKFYRGLAAAQKESPKPKEPVMEPQTPERSAEAKPIVSPLAPLPPISVNDTSTGSSVIGVADVDDMSGKLQELLAEEKAKASKRQAEDAQMLAQKMAAAEAARVEPIYYDGGHYPPPKGSPLPQDTAVSDSHVLQQLMAGMAQQRETINALVALQTEKSAVAEDIVEAGEETAPELAAMYPHGVPFLEGDKPQKPQYETYFEMSKMGTMAARYHAVIDGQDCVALVYDTRFEDGFQYLPPNLGEERITVSVPKLNNAVYTCSSLGLHWTLGCMDVVILIKHAEGE